MQFFDHQANARSRSRQLKIAFVLAAAATVLGLYGAMRAVLWVLGWPPPALFTETTIGLGLLMVVGGWWIESSNMRSGEELARRLGAREIRPDVSFAEKRLLNIVQEMAVAAHMPRPQVMLQPRVKAINAFATGWNQADWVIVVTEGALDWLTREELQALLAHEMSHLHEGDTRINMQLAGRVAGLERLHNYGDMLRNFGKADKVEQTPAVAVLAWVPGQVIMAVGWLGWMAGRLLQAAVAREREWLADARAVQWTRSRDGLGGVLRKVLAQKLEGTANTLHGWQGVFSHMMLIDEQAQARWLDSHPPLEARIARIYGRDMPPLKLQLMDPRTGQQRAEEMALPF